MKWLLLSWDGGQLGDNEKLVEEGRQGNWWEKMADRGVDTSRWTVCWV